MHIGSSSLPLFLLFPPPPPQRVFSQSRGEGNRSSSSIDKSAAAASTLFKGETSGLTWNSFRATLIYDLRVIINIIEILVNPSFQKLYIISLLWDIGTNFCKMRRMEMLSRRKKAIVFTDSWDQLLFSRIWYTLGKFLLTDSLPIYYFPLPRKADNQSPPILPDGGYPMKSRIVEEGIRQVRRRQ